MSTQPIENTYQKFAYTRKKPTGDVAEFDLDAAGSKNRREGSTGAGADLAAVVERVLDDIPTGLDGRLSFNDLGRYRQERETQFKEGVRQDLAELGVTDVADVQVLHDPLTSEVTVLGAGEDRGVIEGYFRDDAGAADELGTVVQLGKLADGARYQLGESGLDARLAPRAMAVWFETNTNASALLSTGGMSLGDSARSYRSLDIRV